MKETPVETRARRRGGRDIVTIVAAVAGVIALNVVTYGYVLRLPLFLDDMVHFRWLEGRSLAEIWSSAKIIGYYRPLTFTLWWALRRLFGGYEPVALHLVNLLLHMSNALMLMVLVWLRSGGRGRLAGLGAAILFTLFPFSYQAVPWVGSLCHLLATALILASICLFFVSRERENPLLRWASVALALLAPFAHETGVLVAPLLALLLVGERRGAPWARLARLTAPYWVAAAVGLTVWLAVPKDVGETWLLNLESRWQNAAYFAQGIGYPVAPLATRLLRLDLGLDDLQAVAAVVTPALLLWAAYLWRSGRARWVVLGIGWFAVAIAPAWLLLGFYYVVDGPRLMYGAWIGAAVLWSAGLVRGRASQRSLLSTAVGFAIGLLAVATSAPFLVSRADLYHQMALAVDGLVDVTDEMPADETLTVVNAPWWISPTETTYAIGHEGVTLVPPYTSLGDLLWLHTGQERPVRSVTLNNLRADWRYWYTCDGAEIYNEDLLPALRQGGQVVIVDYTRADLRVLPAGAAGAGASGGDGGALAAFGGIVLENVDMVLSEDGLQVTLWWRCEDPPTEDVTVFLHLCDEGGTVVAQGDGYPVCGIAAPRLWLSGDRWRDTRLIPLPAFSPDGVLSVKVGLYGAADGERVTAVDIDGDPLPENAYRASVSAADGAASVIQELPGE